MTSDDRSTEIDATVVEPAQDAVTDASPTDEPQTTSAAATSAPAASAPYLTARAGTGMSKTLTSQSASGRTPNLVLDIRAGAAQVTIEEN